MIFLEKCQQEFFDFLKFLNKFCFCVTDAAALHVFFLWRRSFRHKIFEMTVPMTEQIRESRSGDPAKCAAKFLRDGRIAVRRRVKVFASL